MAKDAFKTNKRDLHDDLEGVRIALLAIRGYSEAAGTAHGTAGESKRIRGLLEVTESDSVKHLADFTATAESAAESAAVTRATAGESEGIIGLLGCLSLISFFEFVTSWVVVLCMCTPCCPFCCSCVCTCLPRFFIPCCDCCCCTCAYFDPAWCMFQFAVGHGLGHKESQRWGFRSGRRFAPCLRGGGRGNFSAGRRVYGGRLQVHFPGRQPCTGSRRVREGAVTPSLHPEVPVDQFLLRGRGWGLRQSMGWTKVCSTARSGIWVLMGVASARM